MNYGIAKGGKPLTALPQFLPIGFTETFVQPLDRKAKTKKNRELSTIVCDVRKLTRQISIKVNSEKVLLAVGSLRIRHKALLGNRLVSLNAHSPLPFG